MIHNTKDIYFWYEDQPKWELVIAKKGGSQYRISMSKLFNHKFPMDAKQVYELAKKESQYVEFEEVSDLKLLS